MDEQRIYRAALEKWGADAQTLMAFEEMAELQKELCKCARGKDNWEAIAEEIADVEIMLEQMKILHDCAGVSAGYKRRKLERLVERLGETGLHMAFQDGRVSIKGGGTPVALGPGVSFRMENTSVSAPCNPPPGVPVDALERLKNLCEFCREMEKRGGLWAEREWGVDAATLEFTVAILSELKDMREVHIREAPGKETELFRAMMEAGPGMIVNLDGPKKSEEG